MMLALFAAYGVLFFVVERLFPLREQPIFRRGWVTDLLYVPVHYLMRVGINGALAVLAARMVRDLIPGFQGGVLAGQSVWVQGALLIVIVDLIFYVMHRLKHRVGWLWRLHETHHSSPQLDWLASVRFNPLEKILDRVVYLVPIVWLGVLDGALLMLGAVDVFFGMFIHSNVRWRLGPLVYVFATPEMHHWHHARDPARRECNYGNNFSVFDWLFGTARTAADMPREYGVDDPDYPVEGIVSQFLYTFRPVSTAPELELASGSQ
jgi:sterol desaturase/sphingolipid hydroxylase (fatty acid hydroxylase superfamily)